MRARPNSIDYDIVLSALARARTPSLLLSYLATVYMATVYMATAYTATAYTLYRYGDGL